MLRYSRRSATTKPSVMATNRKAPIRRGGAGDGISKKRQPAPISRPTVSPSNDATIGAPSERKAATAEHAEKPSPVIDPNRNARGVRMPMTMDDTRGCMATAQGASLIAAVTAHRRPLRHRRRQRRSQVLELQIAVHHPPANHGQRGRDGLDSLFGHGKIVGIERRQVRVVP